MNETDIALDWMLEHTWSRVQALAAEAPGAARLAARLEEEFGDRAVLGAGLDDWPDCLAVVALGRLDWVELARLALEG
jgi:hypothetical protein